MITCPSCGHENEAGAKFCSQCATALSEERAPARTERKVVTVLFADLVGFTAQAERLDPEDVQAVLEPYHARLRSELERYGGTVEKFIGDAVMALFGAPVTHEDDPERAVRAALAIRDWIAEEGTLHVRIAVNTGEALINLAARPESGEGMAAGDVVNSAARLQAAAPTNGILAGEATYRATAQTIDYRDATAVEAKGKEEPIPVWEVVQARARFGVDLAPRARGPLVGRDRELELLKAALTRARLQRSLELVTLAGVPGIGKSRLVTELFASIERGEQDSQLIFWRQGRSLPYGEGVSYWALGEMIKAHAGILETDSSDEADAKLTRALEGLIEEDTDWVRSHLLPLVGQAGEAGGSRDEAFAAWRRFFEALAEQRPLVLVFEDVQWADDGLLDFVEHLVDWVRGVPVLVLCTARLELLERRPAWGGGKLNATTAALAPLSDDETAVLISSLSERRLLPAETQTALLDRAGGNPLYAEQYVRMLAERGASEEMPLPESVQGIIAARLDALPGEEKALLQDAAVIGKVFWLGGLEAVHGANELEPRLHGLELKEFVQRARRASVAGETEFAFKHLLVRDVAYGQIPRAERAEKHRRTADWIASLGRPEDHAEMVAHHYTSALELARAAGQDVAQLVARTSAALREAGDRAAALNALPQAERYYAEALALVRHDDPGRPELLFRQGRMRYLRAQEGTEELAAAREGFIAAGEREAAAEAVLLIANISWHEGRHDAMLAHLDDARSLIAGTPPSRAQVSVLSELSRYEMLAGKNDSAIEFGTEALRLARELGLDDLRARTLNNVGTARVYAGDARGFAELEESIELAWRLNSIVDVVRGFNNLAAGHLSQAHLRESRALWEETREIAERFGQLRLLRFVEGGAAVAGPYSAGDWDQALARAEAFLAEVESGSPHYQASSSYNLRALIRLGRGDAESADADAARAVELAREAGDPQRVQPALAKAGFVFLAGGKERQAGELLGEALENLAELRQLGLAAVDLHTLAWIAVVLGREADVLTVVDREPIQSRWIDAARAVASRDFRVAADIMGEVGDVTSEAFYRLCAAKELVEDGRRAEADAQLQPALAFYRSVAAARYVREGEALLAASA